MAKIKTLEEGRALLAEYEALTDLEAHIDWDGYNRLPDYKFSCVCGCVQTFPMGIDDLKQTIDKGWEWKLEHHKAQCYGHDEPDDDDNDDDNDDDGEREGKDD